VRTQFSDQTAHRWQEERKLRQRDYDHALASCDQVLNADPANFAALVLRASVHMEQGDFGEASKVVDHALQINSGYAPAYI